MKTMKNILIVLSVAVLAVSCYEDLSTEATMEIPELNVTGPDDDINIPYGQTLDITVKATQKGRGTKDFTYVWEMDVRPGQADSKIEVGQGASLSMRIANDPSETPYVLTCTVTDTKTGIAVVKAWKVFVSTSLGDGLLVAHTRDDGQTSEVDLVSNSAVTYGKESLDPFYVRDLYSLSNGGQKIQGTINDMVPYMASGMSAWSENNIAIATDRNLFLLDPLTFQTTRENEELFSIYEGSSFGTDMLFNAGGWGTFALMDDGRLYGVCGIISNKYGPAAISQDLKTIFKKNNIAYAMQNQGNICVFNEDNSTFYRVHAGFFHERAFSALNTQAINFDVQGAKVLAGGCLKGSDELSLAFLMKSNDGKHHVVIWNLSPNEPALFGQYELDAPNIDKAVSFAFCDNADVMYYATEDKIYSVILSAGRSYVSELTWKPEGQNEKICSIEQYYQAWYGTHNYLKPYTYEFQIPTNRLQVIITTYDETAGEGKVYLRPFNVSTGRFTTKSNGTFRGFGRITAVTPTKK